MAVGDNHTCIARPDGTVWCWGSNASYQSGQPTGTAILAPTQVPSVANAAAVAAGSSHTCALINDGTVTCWGAGASGQLGDATTTSKRALPRAVQGLTGVIAISAGSLHTCALKGNGTVWCWGNNGSGRLGDGTTTRRTVPVQAMGITNATALAAGGSHTCAATTDRGDRWNEGSAIYCWGNNAYGQLGDDSTTTRLIPTMTDDGNESPIRALSAGTSHTCAIFAWAPSQAVCWGRNNVGQLGLNTSGIRYRTYSQDVLVSSGANLDDTVLVGAGPSTNCTIRGDGRAFCWGANAAGQVGDSTVGTHWGATEVQAPAGLAGKFLQIDSGLSHTCALSMSGDVYCWGANASGQLGSGNRTPRRTPGQVTGLSALTFGAFASEDQLSGANGAAATAIISHGDTLVTAGLDHEAGYDVWRVRRSTDRGANWATVASYSYESGTMMFAPALARQYTGTLYMAGAAKNDDGDTRWLTLRSGDDGETWTVTDDYALDAHEEARAHAASYTWNDSMVTVGSASNGAATRWIVREAMTSTPDSWTTVDEFAFPGSETTEAHGVMQAENDGVFVIGHYTSSSGSHMIIRRREPSWSGTYSPTTWTTSDDFQLTPGEDTVGVAIGGDFVNGTYAIARAEGADGTHWIFRRLDGETGTWSSVDIPLAAGEVSEPLGMFIDGANSIHVFGKGARPGEAPHGILRTSYDHGATWTITDEASTATESSYLAAAQEPSNGALHVVGARADAQAALQWEVRSRSCLGIVAACGNGIVDPGELCDGNCSTCNDDNSCTTDVVHGSATTCDVTCSHSPITACISGDGCCAPGCDATNDLDCCTGRVENNTCIDLSFKITELDATNCSWIDDSAVTRGDRGGIALSTTNVFYTGPGTNGRGITGRFNAVDLSGGRSVGRLVDSLVSDLQSGAVYALANAAGTAITGTDVLAQLIVLNGATGAATTTRVRLSQSIPLVGGSTGIFAGYGRFLIHNGARVYDVLLPSGLVKDLGGMAVPDHQSCSNWAYWGTAETFGGRFYLDYALNPSILRTRVPDGETSVLQGFQNLGNMCSFTLSPSRFRWYFHTNDLSQFRPQPGAVLGFCDAHYSRPEAPATCGNGVPEGSETCDGDCPASCDDGLSCTTDALVGSASSCTAACTHAPISVCAGGDGCCPAGCTHATDSDCDLCAGITQCVGGDNCCAPGCDNSNDSDCPVCGVRSVPAAFEDIASNSGVGALILGDDQLSGAIPLGFTFPFYGTNYANVYVSSNGFLSFTGDGQGCCEGVPAPNGAAPNGYVAGFWADLNPSNGGQIVYQTLGSAPARRFVAEWSGVPEYGYSGNPETFEVVLHENGEIEMNCVTCRSMNHTFAVGFESPTGTAGSTTWTGGAGTNTSNTSFRGTPCP